VLYLLPVAPLFSPAQLAPILGVSESTIKRWVDSEKIRSLKTAGGHRKISLNDLVAFLRASGREVPSLEALGLMVPASQAPGEGGLSPETLAHLLLDGQEAIARTVLLNQFRAGRPMEDLLDRLVAPTLVRVGSLWAEGSIDVYQEHLVTQRAWRILLELRGLLAAPAAGAPLALGGSPEGDPYLLPTLMAELTLAEMGWRTLDLGANVPVNALRVAVQRDAPRLVWLSLTSQQLTQGFLDGYPAFFLTAQARGAAVALGGQGLTPEVQDHLVASAFGTRVAHLKAFAGALVR